MLKRALVISILILVTVAATLPFGESLASYGRRAVSSRTGRAKARRHSRAWWRRRRARLRRQRAIAAMRRRQRAAALRRRRGAAAQVQRPRRNRAARRAGLPAGTADLRTMLAPARLPSVSMSAVEAIPAITERAALAPALTPSLVSAPAFAPDFAPAPAFASVSVPATGPDPAPATSPDPVPATKPAQPSAAPAKAQPTPAKAQPAPALAHAAPAATPRPVLTVATASPLLGASPLASPSPLAAAPAALNAGTAARGVSRGFNSLPVPRSWQNVSSTLAGEFKFSLRGADNRAVGTAVWSRLSLPAAPAHDRRSKTIGGVTVAALRRTVIDRMVAEGGWVVNDFEREIGGERVLVVVAQSEGEGGARRSWNYYFTEAGGQLYSLSTAAPAQFAEAVAADAEGVVSSVISRARAAAAAAPRH